MGVLKAEPVFAKSELMAATKTWCPCHIFGGHRGAMVGGDGIFFMIHREVWDVGMGKIPSWASVSKHIRQTDRLPKNCVLF